MPSELLGYKLSEGQIHTRADGTVLNDAYFLPFEINANRLKKRATIQIALWKDRATFESVLAGGTTPPVTTFPIEITGADFDTFIPDFTNISDLLATFILTHSPGNLENLDFSKFTRETPGGGIILPVAIVGIGLAILTGMVYYLVNHPPQLLLAFFS